jgi:small subunit ribosomal protein S16
MSLVIRLSRCGTNNKPFYQVVVADQRRPRGGKYLERIGFFNPRSQGADRLSVDMEAVAAWTQKGAQLTETVGHLLKNAPQSK